MKFLAPKPKGEKLSAAFDRECLHWNTETYRERIGGDRSKWYRVERCRDCKKELSRGCIGR